MTDQAAIDHWRNRLNAIDRMLTEAPEQHITISSYSMDLAGPTKATEPPLPGGDILDITGPWALNATYGDDPTPRQVIAEWCMTIRRDRTGQDQPIPRHAEALRYLRDETPWILDSPWADHYQADIDNAHARLRALIPRVIEEDEPHDDSTPPEPIDITTLGHLIPDDVMLTRDEAEHFWPHVLDNRAWGNLREKARYHRERGMDIPSRKYPVQWIRDAIASDLTSA